MIKPVAGWVLVEAENQEKQTKGGIYIAETVKADLPQTGEVVAVGPEWINEYGTTIKPPVKVGDKALFKKWGGNETKVDGKDYLFVKFDDFLAII